ncbi:MAG TPA: Hsp20/alpha crystallin family protein [Chloroflexota bacterium]|jgi:HSP20 family protein|nr:Hsp20/alpha crystallin family protein [Chloroflexota bacterium]
MAILPAEVRRPLAQLRQRLHATLDRLRPGAARDDGQAAPLVRRAYSGPLADVEETDDAVIVRAELPGLRPEDFTVEATADRLIIRGEKREERAEQGRGFHRVERRYGAFVRSIALPCEVDCDRAEASYRDGVLRVTLPKTPAAKARQIKITVH